MNKRQFLIWKKSRNNEPEIISSRSGPSIRKFFNKLKTEIERYRRQTKQKRLATFWACFWFGIVILFPQVDEELLHLKLSISIPVLIFIWLCFFVAIAKYGDISRD